MKFFGSVENYEIEDFASVYGEEAKFDSKKKYTPNHKSSKKKTLARERARNAKYARQTR